MDGNDSGSGRSGGSLIELAVDAYGGAELWARADFVEVRFDASGLLFSLKRRPTQTGATVRVELGNEQRVEVSLDDGRAGMLVGHDVEIRDSDGETIHRRVDARAAFGGLRHLVKWDDIDFTYFAGAAWWTYLMGPIAWLRDDVTARVVDDRTVEVTYDSHLATHCPKQRFHLDEQHRVVRHDYTPHVISRLARANHHCSDFREFDGVTVSTRRRVYPARLPGPSLVALDIHGFELQSA